MIENKILTVDANILMRAVFGTRVLNILETYESKVAFYCSEVSVRDVLRYLPDVAKRRGDEIASALHILDRVLEIVQTIDAGCYEIYEIAARERIASRDIDDWPVVATAPLFNCAIWTEDQDFFGSGVATWTTQNVELYLRD